MREVFDFETALAQLKGSEPARITYHEQDVALAGLLGKGDSKLVYDAICNGEAFALGLPNTAHNATRAAIEWETTLQEPKATDTIRALGLLANVRCEVMPVLVNGHPLDAIRMARYADMPWQIRDKKNPASSIIEGDIFDAALDRQTFLEATQGIREDILTLLRHGVDVGRDSFNVCVAEGQSRLYFNDLGTAEFGVLDCEDIPGSAKYHTRHALDAILDGVSSDELDRHDAFLNGPDFRFGKDNFYDTWAQQMALEAAR
jgi:hypothetical protein